ncbi:hypothetical protein CEXT_741641 [Caerostris extrusa]|uniref:Uncharacterized protein n=1 Tax=Caerostris extrusa TaxID=172846 RepID=A0AAV4NM56_CAEEX|nr:hypothetical protein CEXT_741641 [Caerostris extrusa]
MFNQLPKKMLFLLLSYHINDATPTFQALPLTELNKDRPSPEQETKRKTPEQSVWAEILLLTLSPRKRS